MKNPSVEELQNPENFELIGKLSHDQIKDFVIEQLYHPSRMVTAYMIYQVAMVLIGIFFITRSVFMAFHETYTPLIYTGAALIFSFTFLVVIHEFLHGAALKLAGAKKVVFGGYLKKFIFFAEADRFVINRNQFAFIALTPLVFVQLFTLAGVLYYVGTPGFYFPIIIMSTHSLFCAGDIGLLTVFYRFPGSSIFTFDIKEEKTSYFFKKLNTEPIEN